MNRKKSSSEKPQAEQLNASENKAALTENVKEAIAVNFTDLQGKFIHVKVGAPQGARDLLASEIQKVQNDLVKLFDDNRIECLLYVTHEYVDIKIIEPQR